MPGVADVSLVVPVYRGWDHCRALLDRLDVRRAPDWLEVIVVDDASGGAGAALLRESYPGVRVIERPQNGGFAAAVNTGLDASRGAVLAVANSDLLVDLASLWSLCEAVRRQPEALVGPRTLRSDGSTVAIAQRWPTPLSSCSELFAPVRALRASGLHLPAWMTGETQDPDWIIGSLMVFSRMYLDAAGPLDESYVMYGEELDWQRRAAEAGLSVRYVPEVVVHHDESHGVDRASASVDRRFVWIWRSRLRYFERFGSPASLLTTRVLCGSAIVVSLPVWLVALLRPRTRALARAELRRSWALCRLLLMATEQPPA